MPGLAWGNRTCVVGVFILLIVATVGERWAIAGSPSEPAGKVPPSIVGRRVANFVLSTPEGEQRGLSDFLDSGPLVVSFLGTGCPISNKYLPTLNELHDRNQTSVKFLGIYASAGETAEGVRRHVAEYGIKFQVLLDPRQTTVDLLGATRMAETFVLDYRGTVRYHGRIDDRIDYDQSKPVAEREDLREAMDEVLAGKPVSVASTAVLGCRITMLERQRKRNEVTYTGQVGELLHRHCAVCHHPGTAAPFSLIGYQDAANWSEMIREVVIQRRMPPWHSDPRYGQFVNDRRLSVNDVDTIAAWVDAGCPEGDRSRAPESPHFEDGWRIGKPDIVFQMPKEFKVPAQGTVAYKYFVTPTHFEKDVWIQAAEPRPGARSAVHHIIVYYRDPKDPATKSAPVWIAATAPGAEPTVFPPGLARRIPAGAELVWQMHYTPTGKSERDRSEIGFVFAKEPPRHNVVNFGIMNSRLKIPPGATRHKVVSSVPIQKDTVVLSLFPHMHLRGHDFAYYAIDPAGRRTQLLSVPQYDFNWQHGYRFVKPLQLARGSRIECVAHFDNSAGNPHNPDPTTTVRFGEQTWDEMMIGYVEYYRPGEPAKQSTEAPGDSELPETAGGK